MNFLIHIKISFQTKSCSIFLKNILSHWSWLEKIIEISITDVSIELPETAIKNLEINSNFLVVARRKNDNDLLMGGIEGMIHIQSPRQHQYTKWIFFEQKNRLTSGDGNLKHLYNLAGEPLSRYQF